MNSKQRHTLSSNFFKRSFDFLDQEFKVRFIKSKVKDYSKEVVVKKATSVPQIINTSKLMKFSKTKIGKGGIMAAIGIVGWNLSQHFFKSVSNPQPAIPRNYERGYDIINESTTDFGSPVRLASAANKTITPYKSSVRRGFNTTTRAIRDSNAALHLSDNAIRHHHY